MSSPEKPVAGMALVRRFKSIIEENWIKITELQSALFAKTLIS
jgi:hypothetical protein